MMLYKGGPVDGTPFEKGWMIQGFGNKGGT